MAKDKKQKLNTAYQRHLDVFKSVGLILLASPIVTLYAISRLLAKDQYTETHYYLLIASLVTLVVGIVICLVGVSRQQVADVINERLYAVWKYKPETIYRFYRIMARYEKKTKFFEFALGALACAVLGLILTLSLEGKEVAILAFVAAGILFLIGIACLPYVRYLRLRLRTRLFGDAKEIIFSRAGIWYCGRICYFGQNGISYHRVERKELHGQDAIVFYYTQTRGFQQTAKELVIPVSPRMAFAADELVEEFNRSDLLDSKQ